MYTKLTFEKIAGLVLLSAFFSSAAIFFSSGVLRAIFGFYFLLFPAGFLLVSALFERQSQLSCFERLALSIAASIAIIPITILVLYYAFAVAIDSVAATAIILGLSIAFYSAFKVRAGGQHEA